ncbi:hypothetical protein [Sphingomonas sp. CFBP 8760]|uniref:hypothetical protein n=1 Tax=Sphingomonas sp. CFBP 8760 TaxID=2775282 RepID=UPI0017800087|nr:hypothetical protein [Sphingomonas sp. CFBP 8760]MBD8546045.1 hypothetical protein [Sphingomonas sp. CFBP 8760]
MGDERTFTAKLELIDGITDPNLVPRVNDSHFKALAAGSCPLGGESFLEGTRLCYGNKGWKCEDGHWTDLHTNC